MNAGQHELLPLIGIRKSSGQIGRDIGEDVDPGDVHRAKRRAPRPANRGTRDRIDLVDADLAAVDRRQHTTHLEERDPIADEIRRVLRQHHGLAQANVGKVHDGGQRFGARVGGRDDLEQAQISRRVEEMGADEVSSKRLAPSFGQGRNRNSRRVAAHNRVVPATGLDSLQQRALDVQSLDDGLDDPVGRRDAIEILETSGRHEGRRIPGEECVRLDRLRPLESGARRLVRHVQQGDRHAGVGENRRNLRPHDAGAEHGRGPNPHLTPLAATPFVA